MMSNDLRPAVVITCPEQVDPVFTNEDEAHGLIELMAKEQNEYDSLITNRENKLATQDDEDEIMVRPSPVSVSHP